MADRIGVIEEGRLLQLASPREVYGRPENVAVARRLGSPPINLLPMGVLPAAAPSAAATMGVRPEDVSLGEAGIEARIEQVEPLGCRDRRAAAAAGCPDACADAGPGPGRGRDRHARRRAARGHAVLRRRRPAARGVRSR